MVANDIHFLYQINKISVPIVDQCFIYTFDIKSFLSPGAKQMGNVKINK